VKEFPLKCSDCGKELATIIHDEEISSCIEDNSKRLKTAFKIINCPKCKNGSSFSSQQFNGSVVIQSKDPNYLVENEETHISGEVLINSLKLVKTS
jgi:hypothetical protein